jgi:lysine 2,3-aminomutase
MRRGKCPEPVFPATIMREPPISDSTDSATPSLAPIEDAAGLPRPEGAAALRRAVWDAAMLEERVAGRFPLEPHVLSAVSKQYRLRISEYYLGLIQSAEDPIGLQAIPSHAELTATTLPDDPLAEDAPEYAPVPHLTHRYPDRALLLVTGLCPMFCRFCMRKRKTLRGAEITTQTIARGIDYLRRTPAVREVILSGGDPLMLPDRLLERILVDLSGISHLHRVRLHTRMPCVEPARVTEELARMLGRTRGLGTAQPLWIGVHFNHPREVTRDAGAALRKLARAGLPLNNQAVLMRGVNDDPAVLAELYRRLMRHGVHPYYLHHGDQVPGTDQVRLTVQEGRGLVARLREIAPDLAMLHYVLDTPGGGGKVPLG